MPAKLVVSGIGLEELTGPYDKDPPLAQTFVPAAVSFLVVVPLITATSIHALREIDAGARPGPDGRS